MAGRVSAALLTAFVLVTAGCATAGSTSSAPSGGTASSGAGAVGTVTVTRGEPSCATATRVAAGEALVATGGAAYGATMHIAGRPSWRFGYGDGSVSDLHASLFVRDAARLAVPAAPDVPPPLVPGWLPGESASGLAAIPSTMRATAASQWLTWWRRLAAAKVDETQPRPVAGGQAALMDWLRARAERENASFDPPEFASLASLPELRAAARASCAAWPRRGPAATSDVDTEGELGASDRVHGPPGVAVDRSSGQGGSGPRLPREGDRSGSFDYGLIRRIAEQTAADFGVPTDAIDARAHVLDVQGSWWYVTGPGCVLCSPAATTDSAVAAELLSAVFASRLR